MANPLNDNITQVSTVFRKFSSGFSGAAYAAGAASLAALAADWQVVRNSGMSVTLNNGSLAINMGTTNGAELLLVAKNTQTIPLNLSAVLSMSQRIAGNEVRIGIAEVNADGDLVANPNLANFPNNYAGVRFDGTTNTNSTLESVVDGIAATTTQAVVSQASTGSAAEYFLEIRNEDLLTTSAAANTSSSRASSVGRISSVVPNPDKAYRLIVWLRNVSAPASATTVTLNRVLLADIQELQAEVGGGRGNLAPAQAIPTTLVGTNNVTVGGTVSSVISPASNSGGYTSTFHLIAAAGNNLTSVKSSPAMLGGIVLSNAAAAVRYVKLYNKNSAPVLASDTPVMTILVPAGATVVVPIATGIRFNTGLALATTTGIAVTDAGALTASDMAIHLNYV